MKRYDDERSASIANRDQDAAKLFALILPA